MITKVYIYTANNSSRFVSHLLINSTTSSKLAKSNLTALTLDPKDLAISSPFLTFLTAMITLYSLLSDNC